MKKVLGIVLVGTLSVTLGCTWKKRAKGSDEVFVWNNNAEVATLDPALMEDTASGNVSWQIHEGLLEYDPKTLVPIPGVATHWDVSQDGRIYTFYLRKNAKWSNGDPVTAEDFEYSWRRVLEPATASPYAYILYFLQNGEEYNTGTLKNFSKVGVQAVDSYTLKVTLKNSAPFFPQVAAFNTYRPVHRATVEKWGNQWTRPEHSVTNGAYKLDTWVPQKEILLSKNPHYWDFENVQIPRVKFIPVEDRETGLKLHLNGEVTYTEDLPYLKIPVLKKRDDYQNGPVMVVYYYELNVTKPPLNNVKVRQALNMALDKERIVQVMQKEDIVAFNLVPPGTFGYQSPKGPGFDPEGAKKLLAEAGYADPKTMPKIDIYYNTSENHKTIAEMVQNMWKQNLGIEVGILNQEWKVYLQSLHQKKFDVGRMGWVADYADPYTFLSVFTRTSQQNHTGWTDPMYDDLVLNRSATEQDPQKRFKILQEAERMFLENVPAIPIYHYARPVLLDSRVKGFHHNARDIHPLKFARFEGGSFAIAK